MSFRTKASKILKYSPDVLVIQECEQIQKIKFDLWECQPSDYYWYGKNKHKGIAIFTFNGYQIDSETIKHNHDFEYIVPLVVYKEGKICIELFSVWTQNTYDGHYTRQIYRAIEYMLTLYVVKIRS